MGVEIVGAIGRRPGRREWTTTGVSTDSRTLRCGEIFFALRGARCDGHDFAASALEKGAAAAVVSRNVDVPPYLRSRVVRVEDTLCALGDSAHAFRCKWGGRVIAVTGSNGKTTTREMIFHILSEQMACRRSPRNFNTLVGVPLTLFQADPDDRVVVVEVGASAPGEIAALAAIAEPDEGVITNIGESHLAGFTSLEGVAQAKAELIEALGTDGATFLNADDPWFDFLAGRVRGALTSYGFGDRAAFRGYDLYSVQGGSAFAIRDDIRVEMYVPGRHNACNALAALAVADHLELDLAAAAQRLETFRLPRMRYQVAHVRGITVVSDCYNANPVSVRAALRTFKESAASGRKVAVLGDMLELGAESDRLHRMMGGEVASHGLDALWAVGAYAHSVAAAAKEGGFSGPISHAEKLEDAAGDICEFLQPGDAILVKGSRGMQMERLVEKIEGFAPVHV